MTPTLVKPVPFIAEPDVTEIMKAMDEFHVKFQVPRNGGTQELYITLIEEEHEEWVEDYYNPEAKEFEELKELTDLLYVTAALAYQMGFNITKANRYTENDCYDYSITDLVTEIASGRKDKKVLSNLMYCIFGYADAMGWDVNQSFARVHHSNMTKLGPDGKPIRREDGKVLKGPEYKEAYLEDLTDGR